MSHVWLGRAVLVRTAGEIWVGRLSEATPMELVLTEASWLAECGQMAYTLAEGVYRETRSSQDSERDVQRAPHPVAIGRGHVVAWTLWASPDGVDHRLPSVSEVIR